MKKQSIHIYVNGKLSRVIPNLTPKKIELYKKTLSVESGHYIIKDA